MFNDVIEKVNNFYDLGENEQQVLLKEINNRGKKDKLEFKDFLSKVGYGLNSNLSIFWEAIWKSPKGWEEFIYDQLEKLINEAESGNKDALEDISSLMYLTQLEEMSNEFYNKSILLLENGLKSKYVNIRENCSEGILDINDVGKKDLNVDTIKKLQKLLKDENFKLRIYTYSNLNELNLIPKEFKLKKMDVIRAKIQGMGDLLK